MTKKLTAPAARRAALALALPLAGALLLAGCTNDDIIQSSGSAPVGSGSSTQAGAPAPGTANAPSGSDNLGVLTTAATTALAAVSGSKLLSIDQELGGTAWEIHVATGDGSEQEVRTDAAGSRVTAGPSREIEDRNDVAENARLLSQDRVGYAKAATTLTDTVKGAVTELGLDDDLGKAVWEGTVVDGAGTRHDIRLDAASGAVLSNTVDVED
jgi:uncharacterized membrane protein YkoI